jgi:hypothetical protein
MAISKRNPRTILLSGPAKHIENEYHAGGEITPGMLVELYNDSGTTKVRVNQSATEIVERAVALEQGELNKTISDVYATGDLVKVAYLDTGDIFYGLIPSGQDIATLELLQSNGDGKLKAATATTASANLGLFRALDRPGSVTVDTRVRVEVL